MPLSESITPRTEEQLRQLTDHYNSVGELSAVTQDILGDIPQLAMMSGNYVLCDKDNYVYSNAGTTRHRIVFGQNNLGNGTYAILQYLENGNLLFNSVSGPFRVKI